MGNNSSKPWHKKKMFETEGEGSGELDNRAANYDEENLVAEKNKKRSNRDRKEPKNLVSKSSRSNEVNPEFNIDQKEELSYVQNNQLGASLSDDFISAFAGFSTQSNLNNRGPPERIVHFLTLFRKKPLRPPPLFVPVFKSL